MATINIGSFGNTGGLPWHWPKLGGALITSTPWSTSTISYDVYVRGVAQPKAPEKKLALTALDWLDGQVEAVCAKGRL